MDKIIIAFAGKKQSGKDSSCNFLIRNSSELFGPDIKVQKFSFAEPLKEFCENVLGLTHEQCWGTDDQKNTLTRYKWEHLPHYKLIVEEAIQKAVAYADKEVGTTSYDHWYKEYSAKCEEFIPKGLMTARQVIQEVGTGIGRRMFQNIWAEALIRKIKKSEADVAAICDMRFPNEVEYVQKAGGKAIKLTRDPFGGSDHHASETSLDADKYDWKNFDYVLKNDDMTVNDQNKEVVRILREWRIVR